MIQGCRRLCVSSAKLSVQHLLPLRCTSTLSKVDARKRRSQLFDKERSRQRSELGRIEKIEVTYKSVMEDVTMVMNRNISTPYDCARHISEDLAKLSAIALVNGDVWDMHKPLTDKCEIELLTMQSPRINSINKTFWRTCSFILGAVADSAFKDNVKVHLHSFPAPVIRSGSFIYNVFVDLPDWQPSGFEIHAISTLFVKLVHQQLLLEKLDVPLGVALDMFQDNPFKSEQIPEIARKKENKVPLYRLGDHVDISNGPMVNNSGLIGRVSLTAVHKVNEPVEGLYRFQGVALPKGILLNYFAYSILENRAKKLNTASDRWQSDFSKKETNEEEQSVAAAMN